MIQLSYWVTQRAINQVYIKSGKPRNLVKKPGFVKCHLLSQATSVQATAAKAYN